MLRCLTHLMFVLSLQLPQTTNCTAIQKQLWEMCVPHICNRQHSERFLFLDQSLPRDLWEAVPWQLVPVPREISKSSTRVSQHFLRAGIAWLHPGLGQGWQKPRAPTPQQEFTHPPRRHKADQSHLSPQPQPKQREKGGSRESPGRESPAQSWAGHSRAEQGHCQQAQAECPQHYK